MVKITKTLPNGRQVSREVTPQEYIQQGWATQGWAAPAKLQQEAFKEVRKATWRDLEKLPMQELAAISRTWKIVKKLPNGRWVSRRVSGGDYLHGGWQSQGWVIPKYQLESHTTPKDTKMGRNRLITHIFDKQDWARQKLSRDQAKAEYRTAGDTSSYLGHNPEEDIEKLMSGRYKINPAFIAWRKRAATYWAHNYPRYIRQNLTGEYSKAHAKARIAGYARDFQRPPPKVKKIPTYDETQRYRRFWSRKPNY